MASLEDLPVDDNAGPKELFETVNMLDERLCVKDSLLYAVEKSGAQISHHRQAASSATTSGLSFSVVVPSLSTVISRKVMVETQFEVTLSAAAGVPDTSQIVLGNSMCLAPFPFHQLCSNITCSINNTSLTFDAQNTLNEVLRCLDPEILKQFADFTPVQLDTYQDYTQVDALAAQVTNNSPFNGIEKGQINGWTPRGAYYVATKASTANGTGAAGPATATFVVNVFEPVLMSPFLLSTKSGNGQGIYGVQNLDFNFQFRDPSRCRAIRAVLNCGDTADGTTKNSRYTLSSVPQGVSYLHLTYLTPPPSVKLPSRNIVPYLQLQTFLTVCPDVAANAANVSASANSSITSNAIQLASIPDSVILGVRYRQANKDGADSDSWLPLDTSAAGAIQITFNNQGGILSNSTRNNLFEASKQNGLNMSYLEFSGVANAESLIAPVAPTITTAPAMSNLFTCGSLVKLDFGRDIPIGQDWYAPGSIGQFNFQCQVKYTNYNHAKSAVAGLELVMVFVHSGMLINSLGSSNVYVGLLTKENVLQAAEKEAINKGSYDRMYGGSWWSSLKSGVNKALKYAKPVARIARQGLEMSSNPKAQRGAKILGALGAGYSAGGDKFSNRLY